VLGKGKTKTIKIDGSSKFSETLVIIYETTWHHVPEDHSLNHASGLNIHFIPQPVRLYL
jgi:hypothetical protein